MGIELERTVTTAFEELDTRLTVLRNIETALIPSARSAFTIERARFESGRGEVIVFLEMFRGVLMGEMEYQRVLEEFAAQWGTLEQGVGGPVALGRTEEKKMSYSKLWVVPLLCLVIGGYFPWVWEGCPARGGEAGGLSLPHASPVHL
jgi:hypothetical protein